MNTRFNLREYILLIAGRLLKWSTLSGVRGKWPYFSATMPHADPTQGETPSTQPVRLMQHFGFRSYPVAGSELVVGAPRGGATNAVALASDNLHFGRLDLAEGESQQYGKATGVEVYLDKNGQANINSAAGQDVVVNGGSREVAVDGDTVNCGVLTITVAAGVLGGSYVDPFGATTVITTGIAIPLKGKITGTGTRFRA